MEIEISPQHAKPEVTSLVDITTYKVILPTSVDISLYPENKNKNPLGTISEYYLY
jgi:hypothetical protein